LQYLSLTRPDLGFAVNWAEVKTILRYMILNFDHGLCIRKSQLQQLIAYSDSDWTGCPNDRRSTSDYCVFLGPNLLSWSLKNKPQYLGQV